MDIQLGRLLALAFIGAAAVFAAIPAETLTGAFVPDVAVFVIYSGFAIAILGLFSILPWLLFQATHFLGTNPQTRIPRKLLTQRISPLLT